MLDGPVAMADSRAKDVEGGAERRPPGRQICTYADIPEVLSAADVLVMPGDADTMPRVCLEAMAVGAVVVAADIPALRELLEDGTSGLLFPVGDAAAQAAAIARVLTDADLLRQLRTAARRRVADRDVSVAAPRYAAILARIARDPESAPAHPDAGRPLPARSRPASRA